MTTCKKTKRKRFVKREKRKIFTAKKNTQRQPTKRYESKIAKQ